MRVTFAPLGCAADTHAGETVLDAARRVGAPLGNSCGAVGICARCRVRVIEGAAHLAPTTAIEARVSIQRGFAADERLACQAIVRGDCTVTTTYW
jgi:2Fe-2S ferredoxin